MKVFTFLLVTSFCSTAFAGEIKDNFEQINQLRDIDTRIEKKLDLIIAQYIKDEIAAEQRQQMVDTTIEKTTEGIKKGANWISDKANELINKEAPENGQ